MTTIKIDFTKNEISKTQLRKILGGADAEPAVEEVELEYI